MKYDIKKQYPTYRRTVGCLALLAIVSASFVPLAAADEDANALAHAKSLSRAFRNAAENTTPSVVTINVRKNVQPIGGLSGRNPFEGTPYEDFYKRFEEERRTNPKQFQQSGVGSGVIIDASGIILTNNHVVDGADEVTVRLHDGQEYKATEIKTDRQTDLAVLRIENAKNLKAAKMGNSDSLEIGDWVIAIGTPFDLDMTVSAGIISAKGRSLQSLPRHRTTFLQTDAAINPGNSGGPLVNLDGEVIGINTAIASRNGGNDGIGFAVPSNLVKWVTKQLTENGSVERAYLGVAIRDITAEVALEKGLKRASGVLVQSVYPDAPAAEAGLEAGDVITTFAGKKVRTTDGLQRLVERAPIGSQQKVGYLRDGESGTLKIKARSMPKKFGFKGRIEIPEITESE